MSRKTNKKKKANEMASRGPRMRGLGTCCCCCCCCCCCTELPSSSSVSALLSSLLLLLLLLTRARGGGEEEWGRMTFCKYSSRCRPTPITLSKETQNQRM